jgi:hypothetical protein
MGTLLIPHHDVRLGHLHLGRGIHEVLEQMPRLGLFVAPADAAGQQAVQALAISVNCRSQLTFIATAELKASM